MSLLANFIKDAPFESDSKAERNATMNKPITEKSCKYSLAALALAIILFQLPSMSLADETALEIDVSPNIINIASERNGEIRIATRMQYGFFAGNEGEAFVYFNGSDSVENIRATRDSLGNLILKFSLRDLLALDEFLVPDADNDVNVVITTSVGEFSGWDSVYIVDKKAPERNPRSSTHR